MKTRHLKILVTGRVQDVGFRRHAKQQAERLGIYGFARNEPDGSVYIEVEGSHERLEQFLDWCREGSPAAEVKSVESTAHQPLGHMGFETI